MRKLEIEKFLKKVISNEKFNDFNILVGFEKNLTMGDCAAAIKIIKLYKSKRCLCDGALLFLNRKVFNGNDRNDKNYQKALLLHELGHIYTYSYKPSRREYRAHKWAYDKSLQLKNKNIGKHLKEIIEDWQHFNKNNRYYKAYELAKKLKFI